MQGVYVEPRLKHPADPHICTMHYLYPGSIMNRYIQFRMYRPHSQEEQLLVHALRSPVTLAFVDWQAAISRHKGSMEGIWDTMRHPDSRNFFKALCIQY